MCVLSVIVVRLFVHTVLLALLRRLFLWVSVALMPSSLSLSCVQPKHCCIVHYISATSMPAPLQLRLATRARHKLQCAARTVLHDQHASACAHDAKLAIRMRSDCCDCACISAAATIIVSEKLDVDCITPATRILVHAIAYVFVVHVSDAVSVHVLLLLSCEMLIVDMLQMWM